MGWLLFIGFVVLMLLRVPVTMAIGASVLTAIIVAGYGSALQIVPQQILAGVDHPALLAIPFFIMAGNLMNVVGMTEKIFGFASALVGHFRAGLAQVNVLASMVFAGISGSALADMAGLGMIEVKAMRERGYPVDFSAGLTIVSGMMAPLIPPSVALIIYSYLSNTSVARLFLAGLAPGLLVGLALMIYVRMIADRRGFPRESRSSLRNIVDSAKGGIAALVAPGIIVSAIVLGYVTATEAGVLACGYSLMIGIFYRTLTWKKLWDCLMETVMMTTIIMIIIGYSSVMGWLLAIEQIPQHIAQAMLLMTDSKDVLLILLIAFLLVIGCFVEGVPAKIILVPVLLEITDKFGIDRVHFGIILTLALLIGMATPPMGIGVYVMVEVAKISFERITLAVLPMLVPVFVVLLLITFVPEIVLWLPNFIMGPE